MYQIWSPSRPRRSPRGIATLESSRFREEFPPHAEPLPGRAPLHPRRALAHHDAGKLSHRAGAGRDGGDDIGIGVAAAGHEGFLSLNRIPLAGNRRERGLWKIEVRTAAWLAQGQRRQVPAPRDRLQKIRHLRGSGFGRDDGRGDRVHSEAHRSRGAFAAQDLADPDQSHEAVAEAAVSRRNDQPAQARLLKSPEPGLGPGSGFVNAIGVRGEKLACDPLSELEGAFGDFGIGHESSKILRLAWLAHGRPDSRA